MLNIERMLKYIKIIGSHESKYKIRHMTNPNVP